MSMPFCDCWHKVVESPLCKVKMSPFDEMNTQIQAIEREGQSERPANHEPKRTYPNRSDTTDRKEDLKQKEAAKMLGISERHVRRLMRAYRRSGAEGLISKRRGKPSNNRLKAEVKQQAIDSIYSQHHDFGPTLAHEKLTEQACAQVHDHHSVDDQNSLMQERC